MPAWTAPASGRKDGCSKKSVKAFMRFWISDSDDGSMSSANNDLTHAVQVVWFGVKKATLWAAEFAFVLVIAVERARARAALACVIFFYLLNRRRRDGADA
ncbi:hypothetical protein EW146_g921 [Bondarzewia mesenterica]|uniref:Uncharacterized protein n=1 Tax=Bondarzewia mesenterica TaxID=1095465 RepID=A0A4S4M5D9_9AGAM|nr:hypothetical protein EW146_g921 [Bondarzewia mesenterica]